MYKLPIIKTSHRDVKKMKSFATTWMGLEDIMLSEISQIEKDKYHIFSPICRI